MKPKCIQELKEMSSNSDWYIDTFPLGEVPMDELDKFLSSAKNSCDNAVEIFKTERDKMSNEQIEDFIKRKNKIYSFIKSVEQVKRERLEDASKPDPEEVSDEMDQYLFHQNANIDLFGLGPQY